MSNNNKYQQKSRRLTELEKASLRKMHKWLSALANLPRNIPVGVDNEAYTLMQNYIDSKLKEVDEESQIGTYLGNAQNLLLKVAGIYMLNELTDKAKWNIEFFMRVPEKFSDVQVLSIKVSHMQKSIDYFETVAMVGINKTIEQMNKANVIKKKIEDESDIYETITSTLKGKVFEGHYVTLKDAMVKSELRSACHSGYDLFEKYLKTMKENGDIDITTEQAKHGSPPQIVRLLSKADKKMKPAEAIGASDVNFGAMMANAPKPTPEEAIKTLCIGEGVET